MSPPRILIVAGSDSGGGAGIQADIKTVTMLGGFAMTAITALTAQNTIGVQAVHPVPAEMVLRQIDSVCEDIGVDAVKIGMIGSAATAAALAERLARLEGVPIVFDPVMVTTSGSALADAATIAAFERLAAIATVTTPNLPELAALSGREIATAEALEAAAVDYAATVGAAILAKGGHLAEGPLTDLIADPRGAVRRWTSERIDTRHAHGTGCTLSSALATGLGRGLSLADAVSQARDYVRACLLAAPGFGHGHGPMDHALGRIPYEDIHRKE